MTIRICRPDPRARTTVRLTGTTRQMQARLSSDAGLALAYSQAWLLRAGGLKVCDGGVIRAALLAYAGRLHEQEPLQTFRQAEHACKALGPDPEELQAAELRLYTVPAEEPLPPFADIQRSPVARRAMAALMDRADALAEVLLRVRPLSKRPTRGI